MEILTPKEDKVGQELQRFRRVVNPKKPITCQGCFTAIGKEGQGSPDKLIKKSCKGFVPNASKKIERIQSSGCRLIHY